MFFCYQFRGSFFESRLHLRFETAIRFRPRPGSSRWSERWSATAIASASVPLLPHQAKLIFRSTRASRAGGGEAGMGRVASAIRAS